MLIVSRKQNESLVFGNDIVVTIIEIRGDKVRLGVQCPKEISVHRMEVFATIQQWNPPAPVSAGVTLTLDPRHAEILDRVRTALEADLGRAIEPREALERLLEIVESAGEPLERLATQATRPALQE